jgi:thiol:disulfide interchange protein DsbD
MFEIAWKLALAALCSSAVTAWGQTGGGSSFDASGALGLADDGPVSVTARVVASDTARQAEVIVTAAIKPGWHIYSISQPPGGPKRTEITLKPSERYHAAGDFRATTPPDKKPEKAFGGLMVETHSGTAVWQQTIDLDAGVDLSSLKVEGSMLVQPCEANGCLLPRRIEFVATPGPAGIPTAGATATQRGPVAEPAAPQGTAGAVPPPTPASVPRPADADRFEVTDLGQTAHFSLWYAILLGLAGGLILNVMPCVLPVIGLKIFAFMQQAGQNRRQALVLNVWYSLGIWAVFLLLAALALTPKGFGWGQLFSYTEFNVAMAAIMFAMGLSFLGVWEIPIPGFIGHGKASEFALQEGAAAAVVKGILTTLLATPCSAPLLATALLWTAGKPAPEVFTVFSAMALGMASPYLLLGAFPELLRFLPKPGAWMETFQQVMGFVLLGTVVYVLTFVEWAHVVPTVGLLVGVWIACWWVGRIAPTADSQVRLRGWLTAAIIVGVSGVVMFGSVGTSFPPSLSKIMASRLEEKVEKSIAQRLATGGAADLAGAWREGGNPNLDPPATAGIAWRPFTPRVFQELLAARKTVMVDFTADWCLTCKTLEAAVLNTPAVGEAVRAHGVVPLKADWTDGDKEVTKLLAKLGSQQVPVLAIFPGDRPNQPIRLMGGYRTQTVIEALKQAASAKPSAL